MGNDFAQRKTLLGVMAVMDRYVRTRRMESLDRTKAAGIHTATAFFKVQERTVNKFAIPSKREIEFAYN